MYPIRINKYLTQANYCSRRQADRFIIEGRVTINNLPAKLGDKVNENDLVVVGIDVVEMSRKPKIYLALNKPVGVICTTDQNAKDNIVDFVDFPERVYPIGRLDVMSSGLILLTNDGSIVNQILKSQNNVEKEYVVEVDKPLTKDVIKEMQKGVQLEEYKTLPSKVKQISENRFAIVLTEGKNRQIRQMCEHFGYTVIRLARVRIGNLSLNNMKMGKYIRLSEDDVKKLVLSPVEEDEKKPRKKPVASNKK